MLSGKENQMIKTALISAAMFSITCVSAQAAGTSIASLEGNVMVNQGESYQTGHQGMLLKQGDRIMIMEGAKLSLSYSDGCHFTFKSSQIIEVGDVSVCASNGTGYVKATSPMYVQSAPGTEEEDDRTGAIAFGAVAGAGLIYAVTRDDDDSPASQ